MSGKDQGVLPSLHYAVSQSVETFLSLSASLGVSAQLLPAARVLRALRLAIWPLQLGVFHWAGAGDKEDMTGKSGAVACYRQTTLAQKICANVHPNPGAHAFPQPITIEGCGEDSSLWHTLTKRTWTLLGLQWQSALVLSAQAPRPGGSRPGQHESKGR